jgi:L-ascorbate metabolism protein UlaG (beta-lactamase superfamily)
MKKRVLAAGALSLLAAAAVLAADAFPGNGGPIVVTPLIHASVQIEHADKVIQIDPWSAGDLSRAKPADLIVITDDVTHHLDVEAIERLRKPAAPIVMPASGASRIPDGIVLANGQRTMAAGIAIESIAAYDIIPGEPSHPKGEASGYVITLDGRRIYFAGVTECVPEVKALTEIEIAFMPMNIPLGRMTPQAAADCVRTIAPKHVYLYHYEQDYAARVTNPRATPRPLPGNLTVPQSVAAFKDAIRGSRIEFHDANWYPARP